MKKTKHTDNDAQPVISIVVSIFNTMPHLHSTLESIHLQKEDSIEVICIDDASDDGSNNLIREYVSKDSRFRLFCHDKNLGTHISRIDGVKHSTGKYIWLIDGDDTIAPESCSKIIPILNSSDIDIFHVGTTIINEDYLDLKRISFMQKFTKPIKGKLHGKNIFKKCFIDSDYGFNIWDKLFNREFLNTILSELDFAFFPKAQDKYEYYVISYHANTYLGDPKIIGYEYHFGAGITGHEKITKSDFYKYCKMAAVANAIDNFSKNKSELCKTASIINRQELLDDCIANWHRVNIEDRPACFDEMIQCWGALPTIVELAKKNWLNQDILSKSIFNAKCINSNSSKIKTIATYYHRLNNGGVQRVISRITKLWADMGYSVILITDELPSNNDYPIDPRIKRMYIPHYAKTNNLNYKIRAETLSKILRENNVDLFINHAWVVNTLLWDLLVCKTQGVKFITYCHNIFPMLEINGNTYFSALPNIYRLMDGIITLSEVDSRFWSNFNKNVHEVQNPLSFEPTEISMSNLNSKTIIWIGRIACEKRPQDALKIFKEVHNHIPEARMIMVGDGPKQYINHLTNYIKNNNLDDCVELTGYISDVKKIYPKASVFLSTSEYEGFLLTLTEAMSAGIPGVIYELPYLKIIREGKGFIQIPQNDIKRAASEICHILVDESFRIKLGSDARSYAEYLNKYDYKSKWESIFLSLSQPSANINYDESTEIMWDTMFQFYKKGIDKKNKDIQRYKKYNLRYYMGRILKYLKHEFGNG